MALNFPILHDHHSEIGYKYAIVQVDNPGVPEFHLRIGMLVGQLGDSTGIVQFENTTFRRKARCIYWENVHIPAEYLRVLANMN